MRSILITGATGTFGNAFVTRLLYEDEYDRICIYSRDEAKQAVMREKFGNNPRLRFFVGCVRDKERLIKALHGVDVVVHAAALKRIETCFYNPEEAIKTNVLGAMNVVDACAQAQVEVAVLLSTDKAYQPVSVYGQSKAVAESLFLAANNIHGAFGPKFSAVRYGNVFNSTGSVVPRWLDLISKGAKEVPVTDPDATRFFMTAEEAVQLVIDTIYCPQKEVVIPDYLPAYRVGDLVEAMGVKAKIIGLPKLEKLHESMSDVNCSETARRMTVQELREALDSI